jgi:hypothetical protein
MWSRVLVVARVPTPRLRNIICLSVLPIPEICSHLPHAPRTASVCLSCSPMHRVCHLSICLAALRPTAPILLLLVVSDCAALPFRVYRSRELRLIAPPCRSVCHTIGLPAVLRFCLSVCMSRCWAAGRAQVALLLCRPDLCSSYAEEPHDYMLMHPVYTKEYLDSVTSKHIPPKLFTEKVKPAGTKLRRMIGALMF